LEQHFGTHAEETINDSERENHGHTIDVPNRKEKKNNQGRSFHFNKRLDLQTKEPRQRSDRKLDIDGLEVVIDQG
jgi:hypothetical protein